MPVRAVAFDFGHTIIDERLDIMHLLTHEEHHLMPGVRHALSALTVPVAIWANTRVARAGDLRAWFERANLARHISWYVTSEDAGARKPAPTFFDFALQAIGLAAADVLFVGNQLNTDIAGGESYGIRTVYLADSVYRSVDNAGGEARPSFTIQTLLELPGLVEQLV
jgi:putative hydrolase of the HAD superfamily